MCLGVPGRVTSKEPVDGILMGRVDFGGVARSVCLEHVPDVAIGEYVLVHVGFALSKLDEVEAKRVFALLAELGQLDEMAEEEPAREEPA
ncbi:MAG TPA: HypC/HybG/HupF family hydrogenase formation chaperone [Kofleriaceae bacterium]|jgi:hydrogenase expression/formation protein HypC